MKAYLVTTGSIFSLITVLHVWKAIAEWPQPPVNLGFLLLVAALVALPGVLSWWAWRLLRNLRAGEKVRKDSSGSAA